MSERPIRVLQVVHSFAPDTYAGTEVHTLELSRALNARGRADVEIFHPRFQVGFPENGRAAELVTDIHEGLRVHRALHGQRFRPDQNLQVEQAFQVALDRLRPDIVHFQHCSLGGESLPALVAAHDIPSVLTLHDLWGICPRGHLLTVAGEACSGPGEAGQKCLGTCWLGNPEKLQRRGVLWRLDQLMGEALPAHGPLSGLKRGRFLQKSWTDRPERIRAILELPRRLIAPSTYVRDHYVAYGVPEGRIVQIPHGIGEFPGVERRSEAFGVRFGFIANDPRQKGLAVLADAFSRLAPGAAELLVFANLTTPADPYMARVTERLRATPSVHLMGRFPHEEWANVFASFDVLVAPSLGSEAFGLVVLEARAAGVPVVVSETGALPELVRNGLDGLVVRAGDPEGLRSALQRFIDDPTFARRLAAAAPSPRDIAVCAEDTMQVYQRVLAEAEQNVA